MPSRPIWAGVAPSTRTAVNGNATVVIDVPAFEITCASQRRRNERLCQRLADALLGVASSAMDVCR